MLNTANEIIEVCKKDNIHIYDLVLRGETKALKMTEEEMRERLRGILGVMKLSSKETLEKSYGTEYKMIDGFAKMMNDYQKEKDPLTSKFLVRAMAMAFSTSETNANMGTIAAAPTAGSSGIMPAALMAAKEKYDLDDEVLINGLLTSIGIGQIIGKYATFAGAEGGCQAECGSASAMAAAALVEMLGGSPEEAL